MRELWAYRPYLDFFVALLAGLGAWVALHFTGWALPSETIRASLSTGVAALSGMAATAGTFACGTMLNSESRRMRRILKAPQNRKALPGNWVTILAGPLTAGACSLLSLLAMEALHDLALAVVLGSLSLTLLSFYRAVHWLRFTWDQEASEARKTHVAVPEDLPEPKAPCRAESPRKG